VDSGAEACTGARALSNLSIRTRYIFVQYLAIIDMLSFTLSSRMRSISSSFNWVSHFTKSLLFVSATLFAYPCLYNNDGDYFLASARLVISTAVSTSVSSIVDRIIFWLFIFWFSSLSFYC
jgi:hypothetical protein